MSVLLANIAMAAAVLLAGLSLLLFVIGIVSCVRVRHPRLVWVTVAFALSAAQGAVLAVEAYRDRGAVAAGEVQFPILTVVSLGILVCLYFAVLRR